MKFRKKSVVVEAYRLPSAGEDVPHSFYDWVDEVGFSQWESDRDEGLLIKTLEGVMRADPGDWIIKGVAGEFYPCKPDIFAATYEPAGADTASDRLAAAPVAPQVEPKVAASFYTEDAELIGTTGAPIKKVEIEDDGSIHVFIDHWPQAEPLSDEPPQDFTRWVRDNMPSNTVINDPDWWAARLWRAAMRAHRIGGSDAE